MESIAPGVTVAGKLTLTRRLESVYGTQRWIAHDTVLGREVTVLVMAADQPRAAQVLDAARRAASLDHAAFVRILDVGTDGAISYVVEEHPTGATSLAEVISGPGVPAEEVRRIAGELSVALDAASRRGLHHLVLGPDEIFRTPEGDIRIRGLETSAARRGATAETGAALRDDAVAAVAITYAGLTGHWPRVAAVRGTGGGLPYAPRGVAGPDGADVLPPSEVAVGVPRDLDALCRLTLNDGAGPLSPSDYARQIAPWSSRQVVGKPLTSKLVPTPQPDSLADFVPGRADAPVAPAPASPDPVGDDVDETGSTSIGSTSTEVAESEPPSSPPAAVARRLPRRPQPADDAPTPASAAIPAAAVTSPQAAAAAVGAAPTAVTPPSRAPEPTASETGPSEIEAVPAEEDTAYTIDVRGSQSSGPGRGAAVGAAVGGALSQVGDRVGSLARRAVDKVSELTPDTLPSDSNDLDPPAPLVPAETVGRAEGRIALGIVAAFLIGALGLGVWGVSQIGEQPYGAPPPGATVSAKPSPSPPATSSLEEFQIVGAADFDPLGGDGENPSLAAKVFDGNPDTEWKTERYWTTQFGGVKRGVGILVDVGPNKAPQRVDVVLPISATIEVYVASERSLDGATKLGTKTGKGTVSVTGKSPVKGQYVIVWFTEISKDDTGPRDFRGRVGEISVFG